MKLSRRNLLAAGGALTAGGALAATGTPAAASPGRAHARVRTGFERLAADGYALLAGERVGVVTNPTGITPDARHLVDVMHADERVGLVAVFGPEHGFRGTAQAGGSEGRYDDPATGLPVYDTYLKSGQALADVFTASGVDTVVFDIQDAGARFYTYIWTLYD
ncbi:exo-beta-N-acetylmuramidase NamZ domain-containing protein, partial [Streptomyces hydrogenans]